MTKRIGEQPLQTELYKNQNNSPNPTVSSDNNSVQPNQSDLVSKKDIFPSVNQFKQFQLNNLWASQNLKTQNESNVDLNKRVDELNKILSRGGFSSFDEISPYISGLSEANVKNLKDFYQQKTGRNLLMDVSNWLPMEDKYKAFKIIAPERINTQDSPKENGAGINMNPVAQEVPFGSTVQYSLNLDNEIGDREVNYLIEDGNVGIRKEGQTFEGYFPASENNQPTTRLILFEVRYKGQPSQFYRFYQTSVNAESKAENELNKMPGSAPDSELFQTYLETRIQETKDYLAQLEARKLQLENELQTGPTRTTDGSRNSSDVYRDLRQVTQEIERVKAGLAELETSKSEVSKVFGDAVEKPIPLQAVLVARENGQTIPLQLYAKNLGGGKWAIVDLTNPAKPRTYNGEGMLPTDALNQAWNNFISSTNGLPSGQIAVVKPKGLGITNENTPWNGKNSGVSWTKWTADGLGKGSLLLAGVGVAALFVPGGQAVGLGILLGSGVLGGVSSGLNIADRINNGTFKLKDSETAFDLLGIIGGLASLGGLSALTNAGSKGLSFIANGTKFNLQKLGNFTKITCQYIEQGTNVAGGILIGNQYVSAIEEVQKSGMSPEQKSAEIRKILNTAIGIGAIMILGVGISKKLALASQTKNWKEVENLIGKEIKVGDKLPEGYHWNGGQIHRNKGNVAAKYAKLQVDENGKIALSEVERLSNPNTMNKNFLAKLRAKYQAEGLTGEALELAIKTEKDRVQVHHLIPDEVIRNSEMGKIAQKAGYNLDEESNLIGLPRKPENINPGETGHWTNHPRYSEFVMRKLETLKKKLQKNYSLPIERIDNKIILKEMKKVEKELELFIKNGNAPRRPDGSLAKLDTPLNRNLIFGGQYDVRV